MSLWLCCCQPLKELGCYEACRPLNAMGSIISLHCMRKWYCCIAIELLAVFQEWYLKDRANMFFVMQAKSNWHTVVPYCFLFIICWD